MTTSYDVFNGDADGICALIQLRLDAPRSTTLITGVKRDISLLKQVDPAVAKEVTVLDISLAKNCQPLDALLEHEVPVFYADHHNPGDIPEHPALDCHINTAANTCTSLIIDKLLAGRYREWALVGAYGDNLLAVADSLAGKAGLEEQDRARLQALGTYLNYNGYGASPADLLFAPDELFRLLAPYSSPFTFLAERPDIFRALEQGYNEDNQKADAVVPYSEQPGSAVYLLPDQPWARRISGVFSNQLANNDSRNANAVITEKPDGTYLVSVRAPLDNKTGADELVNDFPSGGGRKAAAGINALPPEQLPVFIDAFHRRYHVG